ncbi:MAG: IclR family transcriptional regulator [Deltaproteobacteria bacterium]|nr:IclR family transcriptional regulator [Deltaproteobacteria bacterium]
MHNNIQNNSKKDSQKQKGAQSIHRAIDLLRSVAKYNNKGGATLSKIARDTDLHVATVHRILLALVTEGLLTYDPAIKRYHLGFELFSLGASAQQFAIRERYHPAVVRIAEETEDTVFLIIRLGNDSLCLDRVEGKFPIRYLPIEIGDRRPVGFGVGSLALIAFLPDEQFESIIFENRRSYPQYKQHLSTEDIRNRAKQCRKSGYVVSEGLFHENITGVGVPIFDKKGEKVLLSISVSAISQRMSPNRIKKIAQLIMKVSQEHA